MGSLNIKIRQGNSQEHIYHLLPDDFQYLYSRTNGMLELYPDYMDNEGFLFYPIQFIEKSSDSISGQEILVFTQYMHKSWWYGVKISDHNNYSIGIIPNIGEFKNITNSLADFIVLYLEDSEDLYDLFLYFKDLQL